MYLNLTSSSPAQIFNIKLQLNNVLIMNTEQTSKNIFTYM